MANIFDVAQYILSKKRTLTTMKLQKLCYYAQAWHLVWEDKELFEEDFQAWANGPVCKDLYVRHRGFFEVDETFFDAYTSSVRLTDNEKETVDIILRDYGDKAPHWLSELTHQERPWKETRGSLPAGSSSDAVIPKELMQGYYTGLLGGDGEEEED